MRRVEVSQTEDMRSGYLLAARNARLEELVPAILGETKHDSAIVRASAVDALAFSQDSRVRSRLWETAADDSSWVRKRSLRAIAQQGLRATESEHLLSLLDRDQIQETEYSRVIRMIRTLAQTDVEQARQLYQTIVTKDLRQGDTRRALEELALWLAKLERG